MERGAGITLLAATGTDQFASEFKEIGHGVFSYSLIEGLGGAADGASKDGKITVKELAAFLDDKVPELTQKYRGQSQYPHSFSRGQDFPLVVP